MAWKKLNLNRRLEKQTEVLAEMTQWKKKENETELAGPENFFGNKDINKNESHNRACLKNGQHVTQSSFMLSSFKNWCFWFPYILNFFFKKAKK